MKWTWRAGAALLAVVNSSVVVAQNSNCYEENGNWYCDQVDAIAYSNFGTAGQYQKVTQMGSSGQCDFAAQSYAGGMAPMDGEVSWHFRGPLRLKQFAFYTPGSGVQKRSLHPSPLQRRYGHKHLHQQVHQERDDQPEEVVPEKRAVGDIVVATINGKVVSWTNQYAGGAAWTVVPAPATPASAPAPAPASASARASKPGSPSAPQASNNASPPAPSAASTASSGSSASQPAASMNAGAGQWGRQAYYNAEQSVADGLVFLNHDGGQGSGVFDTVWGNSLSYASADNSAGSASPVTLADTLIGDNSEFIIMTDKSCSDGTCGTVRPGTVAYHGFDGASKLFLLEFSMPLSGGTGFNADMPAAWMLNAQIPRTMQYGSCSCWSSGCGEFDVFEVLDSGNQKCKSTWHGVHAKGDSNWFQRPIGGTKKAAVLFDGTASTAHITWLPDDTNFDTTIAGTTVAGFVNAVQDPSKSIKVALDG